MIEQNEKSLQSKPPILTKTNYCYETTSNYWETTLIKARKVEELKDFMET
jgi:hypothetical protein